MIYLCLFCDPEDTIPPCEGEIDLATEIVAESLQKAAEKFAISEAIASCFEETLVDRVWVCPAGGSEWRLYRVTTDLVSKAVLV